MERDEIVRYWLESSEDDYQVMQSLFDNGIMLGLVLSHLVIEKLLKAYYVKCVDINYPRIHNLVEIAVKANLELSEAQEGTLVDLTTFNLRPGIPTTRTASKRRPPDRSRRRRLPRQRNSGNGSWKR